MSLDVCKVNLREESANKPFEENFWPTTDENIPANITSHSGLSAICHQSESCAETDKLRQSSTSPVLVLLPYKCLVCERILLTVSSLSNHIITHILGDKGALCGLCYKSFTNHIRLNQHYKLCHNIMLCDGCGSYLLDNHPVTGTNYMQHKCEAMRRPDVVAQNTVIESAAVYPRGVNESGIVRDCVEPTSSRRYLIKNTTSKRSKMLKKCQYHRTKSHARDVCGFAAAYASSLVIHQRKHTGEKPHVCDVCGYATTRAHAAGAVPVPVAAGGPGPRHWGRPAALSGPGGITRHTHCVGFTYYNRSLLTLLNYVHNSIQ